MKPEEAAVFEGFEAVVRATYDAVMRAVTKFGPVEVEAKKNSIHLIAGTAFAIVHPRKSALSLSIRTDKPLVSTRVAKVNAISRGVVHNEILLAAPGAVDRELTAWLKAAYTLGAEKTV